MKPEISNTRKTGKFTKTWKLNDIVLNKQWVKEKKITNEIREKNLKSNENEYNKPKLKRCRENHSQREIYKHLH